MLSVSVSRLRTFLRCPRKHHIAYTLGYRPPQPVDGPLYWGSAWHRACESFWDPVDHPMPALEPFLQQEIWWGFRAMTESWYTWLNGHTPTVLAIEAPFSGVPLRNPRSGEISDIHLAGIIDLIIEIDGGQWVVEHKSTMRDILTSADYWRELDMAHQPTAYLLGAQHLGYHPVGVLYDVLRRPTIHPLAATPAEVRKYTRFGTLYANQRERDETPEQFGARLVSYPPTFQIRETLQSPTNVEDFLTDVCAIASMLEHATWRNPHACAPVAESRCPYWDHCAYARPLEAMNLVHAGNTIPATPMTETPHV